MGQCFDSKLAATLTKYSSTISTLAYSQKVEVPDTPPKGCAIVTVSDKVSAHLVLKGLINPSKEVEKLEKLRKAAEVPDYTTKVPEDVRKANQEKLCGSEAEVVRLAEAMKALTTIEV